VSSNPIKFRLVPGIRATTFRAIGFLEGDGQLNAWAAFSQFDIKCKRQLLTYMQGWVDGANTPKTRFHGWPNDEDYKACFVFKIKENRLGHRLYGLLVHPQPIMNGRLQVCVLCIHAKKTEWETDRAELERAKQWCLSSQAKTAIGIVFPEESENQSRGSAKQWKH